MLSDLEIKNAMLEVCVDGESIGTAWLISPNIAITAAHVVESAQGENGNYRNQAITLKFIPSSGDNSSKTDVSVSGVKAKDEHDVAIIILEKCIEVYVPRIHPLASSGKGKKWTSYGFPIVNESGFAGEGSVAFTETPIKLEPTSKEISALQLSLTTVRAKFNKGMSGAAVFVNDVVAGIIIKYPEGAGEENTVFAVRVQDIAKYFEEVASRISSSKEEIINEFLSKKYNDYVDKLLSSCEDLPCYRLFESDFGHQNLPPISQIFVKPAILGDVTQSNRIYMRANQKEIEIDDVVQQGRHILLQGEAGCGKTTTLMNLCARLSIKWLDSAKKSILPVYVTAQDLLRKERDGGLNKIIKKTLEENLNVNLPEDFFSFDAVDDINLIFLIVVDGLDEIISSQKVKEFLNKINTESKNAKSSLHFLICSRPFTELHFELKTIYFDRYVFLPFEDQAEELSKKWAVWHGYSEEHGRDFFKRAKSLSFRGLVESPAMLTMALKLHFDSSANSTILEDLVSSRARLYDMFIQKMIDVSRKRIDVNKLIDLWKSYVVVADPNDIRNLVSKIEILLMEVAEFQQTQSIDKNKTLEYIAKFCLDKAILKSHYDDKYDRKNLELFGIPLVLTSSGLIYEKNDSFHFIHNTIREFFCAKKTTSRYAIQSNEAKFILDNWGDRRWREIALMSLLQWSECKSNRSFVEKKLYDIAGAGEWGSIFVASAVSEGISISPEARDNWVNKLVDSLARWHPCANFLKKFGGGLASPNPMPVLKQLLSFSGSIQNFISVLKEGSDCSIARQALIELAHETLDRHEFYRLAISCADPITQIDICRLAYYGDKNKEIVEILRRLVLESLNKGVVRRRALQTMADLVGSDEAIALVEVPDQADLELLPLLAVLKYESTKCAHHLLEPLGFLLDKRFFPKDCNMLLRVCRGLFEIKSISDIKSILPFLHSSGDMVSCCADLLQCCEGIEDEYCSFMRDGTISRDIKVSIALSLVSLNKSIENVSDVLKDLQETMTSRSEELKWAIAYSKSNDFTRLIELAESTDYDSWERVQAIMALSDLDGIDISKSRLLRGLESSPVSSEMMANYAVALLALGEEKIGLHWLHCAGLNCDGVQNVVQILCEHGYLNEIRSLALNFSESDEKAKILIDALHKFGANDALTEIMKYGKSAMLQDLAKSAVNDQ